MARLPKYIRVTNFEHYQHGGEQTKYLPWVKLYVSTLTDIDLMALPAPTFKVFICLLLLARRMNNRLAVGGQNECRKLAQTMHLTSSVVDTALHELLREGLVEPYRVETPSRPGGDEVEPHAGARAHVRSPSPSTSASEDQPQTQDLVAHFCERVTRNGDVLTKRTRGHTAREVGKLVQEGIAPDLIRRALEIQADKGKHPSILHSLVQEAQAEKRGSLNGKRGLSAAEILALPAEEML